MERAEKEVDYLNENFGFSYNVDSLRDVYENCEEVFSGSAFHERIREDIELLSAVNTELAEEFKELLRLICRIIVASDELITEEEQSELQTVEDLLEFSVC